MIEQFITELMNNAGYVIILMSALERQYSALNVESSIELYI